MERKHDGKFLGNLWKIGDVLLEEWVCFLWWTQKKNWQQSQKSWSLELCDIFVYSTRTLPILGLKTLTSLAFKKSSGGQKWLLDYLKLLFPMIEHGSCNPGLHQAYSDVHSVLTRTSFETMSKCFLSRRCLLQFKITLYGKSLLW